MKFVILEREGVSRRSAKAIDAALTQVDRSLREWDLMIEKALKADRLSNHSKSFIRRQWYGKPGDGPLSLGNRAVHRAVTVAAMIVLLVEAEREATARNGRFRFRMLTTTPDLGITDFALPTIDFTAIARHFDQAARAASVDALGFIDIALVEERTRIRAQKIAVHVHGAIRGRESWFRVKAAQRAASPRRSAANELGLKVCKISSKRRDWGPKLSRKQISMLAYYVAKRSCGRKIIFDGPKGRRSKTALHGWTLEQALRQLECYSHCDVLETTRGVGNGKRLRASWKRVLLRLLKWKGPLRGLKIDHTLLAGEWERVWSDLRPGEMRAAQIVGGL